MQRCARVSGEVRELIRSKNLDLLLVQEPYVIEKGGAFEVAGLGQQRVVSIHTERPWAAVVACDPNLKILQLSQLCTAHCSCAQVQAPGGPFYAVSCYFQHSHEIGPHLNHLEKVLLALRGEKVVVSVDANARSELWDAGETCARGAILEEFIAAHGLLVVNADGQGPTYLSPVGASHIDVTLATPSMDPMLSNWRVRGDWCTSDHQAISLEFSGAREAEEDREAGGGARPARFDVRRADWDCFSEAFGREADQRLRDLPLDSPEGVESMAVALADTMIEACKASMPRKVRRKKTNPWWTSRLSTMKARVTRSRYRIRRAKDETTRQNRKREYRILLRAYTRMIRAAKRDSWKKFVTLHGNAEPWGAVYKLQADRFRVERVVSTLRCGDRATMGMRETAQYLLHAHVPDDDPSQDTAEQAEIRSQVREFQPDTGNADPFDHGMITAALKKMANGKAPGPDLIEVEVLKMAYKTRPEIFLNLFNACLEQGVFPATWKEGNLITLLKGADKDPTDPKSYRPICLLSVVGKLFEKLIKARLAESVLAPGQLSERQYGFREKRSCEDAIVELRRIIAESDAKYTIGILFDIAGAFDNVWWPLVLKGLADRACQANIYWVMRSYFSNRRVGIALGDVLVSKIPTRGCPQGSVLGPTCWNIMFDAIIRALIRILVESAQFDSKIYPPIVFADDTIKIYKAESRVEAEQIGQAIVDCFVKLCEAAKLTVSAKKTEAIVFRSIWKKNPPIGRRGGANPTRKRKQQTKPTLESRPPPAISLGDSRIKFKDSVRYLGVHFNKGMGVKAHVENIRSRTMKLFGRLTRLARGTWGLRFGAMRTIYNGAFLPIVTYAAAGWSDLCNAHDYRGLRAAQRRALISVTGAYRTISYEAACVISGALPVDLLLEQSRARYNIRVGLEAKIGAITAAPESADAVCDIRAEAVRLWGERYAEYTAESPRTVSLFFPQLRDRLDSDWIRPNHFVTQVLSGHGQFREFLARREIARSEECSCGAEKDSVRHFLLECPEFEPQRVTLLEFIGDREWPGVAQFLVSSPEAFKVLNAFCKECLWIRENSPSMDEC